jgi:hypothetical protein
MNARPILSSLAASVLLAVPTASAGVVDMQQSPLAQTVPVGATVNVKIVVNSPNPGGQPWDALDAVISWDPTKLTLAGSTQIGAGAPFFLTGFLPDPDGVNSNLSDGDAIFTALGLPGSQIFAPPAPAQLVVTTLQFIALAPTPGTPVDYLPTIGNFGKTRVLLGGFNVTGDASSVAFVEIVVPCPPSGHNCFTIGTAGCSDAVCCDTVCAVDPFCCSVSWDGVCVGEASDLCAGCGDPEAGSCCDAHGTPFCDNRTCCDQVCAIDPFCCDTSWDAICVEETLDFPACACDPCQTSDESCFTVHGSPGCSDTDCCTLVCASDPFCCDVEWDQICKDAANVLCGGCGDPASGSCFCPHPNVGCNESSCCRVVCELDPFCCEVQWDGICASEANTLCTCRFDVDVNGVVDAADLAVFLGAWATNQCPFDADNNGNVDGADLAVLLGEWGPCP